MTAPVVPQIGPELPGVPGAPEYIGPVPCPGCGRRTAVVHHVLAPPAPNCPACWHLWAVHGPAGCSVSAYPADSLTGVPCPCEHPPIGAADACYAPMVTCGACGIPLDLDPMAYGIGLAAGRLAERGRH